MRIEEKAAKNGTTVNGEEANGADDLVIDPDAIPF